MDENGVSISDIDHIGKAFTQFYRGLFTTSKPTNIDTFLNATRRKVTQQMNDILLLPFSK